MAYIIEKECKTKRRVKRGKCVDPGAKPNWATPHKKVKSSFDGEKLMTTRYVDKSRRKKTKLDDGWRGNNPTVFCNAAKTPERLGIPPPSWFPCSKALRNKEK